MLKRPATRKFFTLIHGGLIAFKVSGGATNNPGDWDWDSDWDWDPEGATVDRNSRSQLDAVVAEPN